MSANFWTDAEIIDAYTREQAIEDGTLIDVSTVAREAGFKYPVAITSALWAVLEKHGQNQDTQGRLWDVLWMGQLAARRGGTVILYKLLLTNGRAKMATLKMICGPGDDAEPVITIMLPDED